MKIDHSNIKHILLLGLGCGSMAKVLYNQFPSARITGVEIDKKMIEIGKKYFELKKINKLKIVISDAYRFIKSSRKKQCYDLIVSDLFIGCETPKSALDTHFLKMIYQILRDDGIFICNCSYNQEHKAQTDNFLKKVTGLFPKVKTVIKYPNFIIRAYK